MSKVCGYDVEDLVAFATACRRQGITEQELRTFVQEMSNAYECVFNETKEIIRDQIESIQNSMIEQNVRG